MTDRTSLLAALQKYQSPYPAEQLFVPRFIELLGHPDSYQRTHLPDHITGSSWIVNRDHSKVLLVQHAKLKKWLQPGGHADGDENVFAVALREAQEETGLTNLEVAGSTFFDIDIHPIPERQHPPFPRHDHYDVRFLFVADDQEPLLISDESTDLRWVPAAELERFNPEASVVRLRDKALAGLASMI